MKVRLLTIFSLVILFLFTVDVNGQSSYDYLRSQILERQQSTRSQIQSLDEQIESLTNRLTETSREYDEAYRRYEETNRLISLREERLRQMNREQSQIVEELRLIEQNLANLQRQLDELVQQYRDTLTYLYKHGRTTELALLLTATSFNQLLVRSYYLQQFNAYLEGQVSEIEIKQQELEKAANDLQETKVRNDQALAAIRSETEDLERQRNRQQRQAEELRANVANLEEQKTLQEQQRENLENTMNRLVAEEQRLRRAANSASPGELSARPEFSVSDEDRELFGERFREQKGQLPWPVDNGVITQRFGNRAHPVFNTRTQNLGIDIATLPRSSVRVVSDGFVYTVQPLQGYGDMVFVNHGSYLTAYGNLSDIYVRPNQVLSKGDIIGLSGDEESIRGPVLFFVIREGSQIVNPESWLQRPSH